MVRKFDSLFIRRATVKKRSFSVKKSTRLVMYNFQIFCTIFLIITTLITWVVPQLTDNVPSAVDDGIVKKVKKINQDGSYTIGYLSDDGSYKIEHRDIFGNINGTFGWLDEQNQTKKVNYSSKNATAPVKLVSIAQTTPTLISAASISSTTSSIPTFVQRIPTRTTLMVTPTATTTTTTTTGLPNYSIDSTNDNDDVYNSGNIVSSSPRPLFTTTRHHLSKLSNSPFFSTTTPLPAAPSSSSSSSSVIVQNNGQFFSTSTTPASNFLVQKKVIVQKPVPADNDNYYQVEEPEPEVSEIRKRFFSPPPPPPPPSSPVIFLPSVVVDDDQENNNNEIIDEIQPPVSTHAFQMLLRHLIDRQRKLEYVNMLTRQRHQATNRRHYYQYQQDDNINGDEYLPINVREMLLLRMLQLAMNPALPVHVEQNQEAAQNSYYRRQHRNVEILGEEGAEIRQQRRRRTKRYKKSDNMLIGEDEEMDYVE